MGPGSSGSLYQRLEGAYLVSNATPYDKHSVKNLTLGWVYTRRKLALAMAGRPSATKLKLKGLDLHWTFMVSSPTLSFFSHSTMVTIFYLWLQKHQAVKEKRNTAKIFTRIFKKHGKAKHMFGLLVSNNVLIKNVLISIHRKNSAIS